MANVDAAVGFVPIRHSTGGEIRLTELKIASGYNTALGAGDPVVAVGDGTIAKAAAGTANSLGVFCGCEYVDAQGNPVNSQYWPAGTVTKGAVAAKASVWRDPFIVYKIQCDTLAATDEEAFADWDSGTPSATTRLSGVELVASSTGTSGKAIRILGLHDEPGNEYGVHANAEVMFAEHAMLTGTDAAGGV
jgi:hypothetical protein